MPGKKGGPARVLPRPRKAPDGGLLGRVAGAVVDGARQMGSDAVWAFTHPKERLLGQGRAAGRPIVGPDGRVYTLSSGEVAASPGRLLPRKVLEARKASAERLMGELRHTRYGKTLPLNEKALAALNAGQLPGVQVAKVERLAERGIRGDDLYKYRQPVLIDSKGRITVGPPGSHHHELYRGADAEITSGAAVQAELWNPVRNHPHYGDIEPRLEIGGWAANPISRRQKAAIVRAYQAAARAAMAQSRKERAAQHRIK